MENTEILKEKLSNLFDSDEKFKDFKEKNCRVTNALWFYIKPGGTLKELLNTPKKTLLRWERYGVGSHQKLLNFFQKDIGIDIDQYPISK